MSQHSVESRSALSFRQVVSWAWTETPPVHRNRTNLLIHIVAVPLFVLGHVLLVASFFASPWLFVAGIVGIAVSLSAQKWGHSLERTPVHPFTGAVDFVRRIYAGQFCNFWRFLFSGRWHASFKAGRTEA